jgi:23S rRNA (adenine2030-N6)-methyltransferase
MNYRHAFHAGNHADVLKHVVLAQVISYLAMKEKPFAVLDAHAGIGAYDLLGPEALKTDEWRGGIGLMGEAFAPEVEAILKPYRAALAALNPAGGDRYYPGSPEIIVQGLRAGDRLIANELHPVDADTLADNYRADARVRVSRLDALGAIKASLPFPERRGLVLIDPPYEVVDETARVAKQLRDGVKRFATGTFMIWYPVTTEEFATRFVAAMKELGIPNMVQAELRVKLPHEQTGLAGSGLVIVNPPFVLEAQLQLLLPALAARLGVAGRGRSQIAWLTPPT